MFLSIIRLDGLRLDDDGGIAAGERFAFGSDRARHIARGQPQGHRDGGNNRHSQVLDSAHEALFLLLG